MGELPAPHRHGHGAGRGRDTENYTAQQPQWPVWHQRRHSRLSQASVAGTCRSAPAGTRPLLKSSSGRSSGDVAQVRVGRLGAQLPGGGGACAECRGAGPGGAGAPGRLLGIQDPATARRRRAVSARGACGVRGCAGAEGGLRGEGGGAGRRGIRVVGEGELLEVSAAAGPERPFSGTEGSAGTGKD